jgi:hypothetical protein
MLLSLSVLYVLLFVQEAASGPPPGPVALGGAAILGTLWVLLLHLGNRR